MMSVLDQFDRLELRGIVNVPQLGGPDPSCGQETPIGRQCDLGTDDPELVTERRRVSRVLDVPELYEGLGGAPRRPSDGEPVTTRCRRDGPGIRSRSRGERPSLRDGLGCVGHLPEVNASSSAGGEAALGDERDVVDRASGGLEAVA